MEPLSQENIRLSSWEKLKINSNPHQIARIKMSSGRKLIIYLNILTGNDNKNHAQTKKAVQTKNDTKIGLRTRLLPCARRPLLGSMCQMRVSQSCRRVRQRVWCVHSMSTQYRGRSMRAVSTRFRRGCASRHSTRLSAASGTGGDGATPTTMSML